LHLCASFVPSFSIVTARTAPSVPRRALGDRPQGAQDAAPSMLARLQQAVTLNVMVSNMAARALYERIGFNVEREFQGNFQGRPCSVAKLRYETAA